jgi:hypothetical protein
MKTKHRTEVRGLIGGDRLPPGVRVHCAGNAGSPRCENGSVVAKASRTRHEQNLSVDHTEQALIQPLEPHGDDDRQVPREPDAGTGSRGRYAARDNLVITHLHLVRKVARGVRRSSQGTGARLEDLEADGKKGLVEAATRFDATRGTQFIAFANGCGCLGFNAGTGYSTWLEPTKGCRFRWCSGCFGLRDREPKPTLLGRGIAGGASSEGNIGLLNAISPRKIAPIVSRTSVAAPVTDIARNARIGRRSEPDVYQRRRRAGRNPVQRTGADLASRDALASRWRGVRAGGAELPGEARTLSSGPARARDQRSGRNSPAGAPTHRHELRHSLAFLASTRPDDANDVVRILCAMAHRRGPGRGHGAPRPDDSGSRRSRVRCKTERAPSS